MKSVGTFLRGMPLGFCVLFLWSTAAWSSPKSSTVAIEPAAAVVRADDAALLDRVHLTLGVRSAAVQKLSIVHQGETRLAARVEIDANVWTLDLTQHSVRSPHFQVLVQKDESETLYPHPAPPIATYRGTVREVPGTEVRATLWNGSLQGVIYAPDEVFGLQPLSMVDTGADPADHVVYRNSDLIQDSSRKCGTFDGNGLTAHQFEPLQPIPQPDRRHSFQAGTGLKITDLGLDADFEFYQLNGSNVNNTVIDMETVISGLEPYYEVPEIGITYEITTIIVRTTSGAPYTSTNPNTLLEDEFRATWMSPPQTNIRRDTAHLFTGKNVDGSVIGIAYLNGICSTNIGYGLSQSRFSGNALARYALTAHELGHNWSAPHCDGCNTCPNCCRIMCSGLGGCTGILTSFGCDEIIPIVNFKNSRGCLSDLLDPQLAPFFDDFPSTTLNTSKWSYNKGGVINTAAVNEPSAPNAIELDAEGDQLYQDDELRTNFIHLNGLSNLRLSYYTEARGPGSGEPLFVEYFSDSLLWKELNQVDSNGSMQNSFVFHTHTLPPDAYFNQFRVRFRTGVSGTSDKWYIDDVIVTNTCTTNADCDDLQHCNGQETCSPIGCIAGTYPCGSQLCNEFNNTCVDCLSAADCSDGLFCNGQEICTGVGTCTPPTQPACLDPNLPACDESTDRCLECVTNADCSDGFYCNGVETCTILNTCDSPSPPCEPQACYEPTDQCVPPGTVALSLASSGAVPGSTVNLFAFADNVNDISSYQMAINITRTSGSGNATVNCPGGVVISKTRPDYIFNGLQDLSGFICAARQATSSLLSGSTFVSSTPKYLATYKITLAANVTIGSTFDITLTQNSFLQDEAGLSVLFNRGTATLTAVNTVCDPPVVSADGCRAVLITPAANPTNQALRVTSPDYACLNKYVQADGSLGGTAVSQSAAAWATVVVTGPDIVPVSNYSVRAECGAQTSGLVSATTDEWGNTNGVDPVDIGDILCVLDGYNANYAICSLPSVDLLPCDPDGVVELADVSAILDAYAGLAFPCAPVCPPGP